MKLTWDKLLAVIVAGSIFLFGEWNVAIQVLVIFMALDILTGMVRAFVQKELSSKESWRGVGKKSLVFVVIAVAHQLDRLTGTGATIRGAVVLFYCASEGLSIIENVAAAGLPLPEILKNALKLLNGQKYPAPDNGQ